MVIKGQNTNDSIKPTHSNQQSNVCQTIFVSTKQKRQPPNTGIQKNGKSDDDNDCDCDDVDDDDDDDGDGGKKM